MTMTTASPEVAQELEAAQMAKKEAETAYLRALAGIVEFTTLEVGDHGFDWNVDVPASKMHDITQQIVNIEYDIEERFHVRFRTFAKAVPG
jgi:hypothetical protein